MTNDNNSDQLQKITQNLASITSALGTLSNVVIEDRERITRLEQFSSENAARLESLDRLAEGLALNAENCSNLVILSLSSITTLLRVPNALVILAKLSQNSNNINFRLQPN